MALRIREGNLGYGILISGIQSPEDAVYLHHFFEDRGLEPVASRHGGQLAILLHGLSREAFDHLIDASGIEVI